jgi:hypothetical protein
MKTLFICVTVMLFAAGVNVVSAQDKRQDPKAAKEITAALNSTAEGWNAGDLSNILQLTCPTRQK